MLVIHFSIASSFQGSFPIDFYMTLLIYYLGEGTYLSGGAYVLPAEGLSFSPWHLHQKVLRWEVLEKNLRTKTQESLV